MHCTLVDVRQQRQCNVPTSLSSQKRSVQSDNIEPNPKHVCQTEIVCHPTVATIFELTFDLQLAGCRRQHTELEGDQEVKDPRVIKRMRLLNGRTLTLCHRTLGGTSHVPGPASLVSPPSGECVNISKNKEHIYPSAAVLPVTAPEKLPRAHQENCTSNTETVHKEAIEVQLFSKAKDWDTTRTAVIEHSLADDLDLHLVAESLGLCCSVQMSHFSDGPEVG